MLANAGAYIVVAYAYQTHLMGGIVGKTACINAFGQVVAAYHFICYG